MDIPDIIDNRSPDRILRNIIKKMSRHSHRMWIATGYFYLNGFDLIKEDLKHVKEFKMIIGEKTDEVTKSEIAEGYRLRSEPESLRKTNLKNELNKDINRIDQNDEQQQNRIKDLHDFIAENNKVDIRVYVKTKFHSKAYIFESSDVEGSLELTGIVGSSNFSRPGLESNTELNNTLKQKTAVIELIKWFEDVWEESEVFRDDLLQVIEESAPYNRLFDKNYLPPFELFKKILYFYLNESITTIGSSLAEFQKIGVENVIDKIREYNGAIVADSVGLGKTFIGGEVIRRYQKDNKKCLCLVPKSIIGQWREHLQKFFGLDISESLEILSHDRFSRMINDELNLLKRFDLILIDEAHRFRNKGPDIKRSKNIEQFKGKDFILMSATPLNNTILDVKNLINIFTPTNRLISNNLDPNAFDNYNILAIKERKEGPLNLEESERKNKLLNSITEILEQVMILRTRTAIKQQYPNLRIGGKRIEFSNPITKQIEYDLANDLFRIEEIAESSDFIAEFLSKLFLPHINIISGKNGRIIEALYRILLLKRLESSIYAFVRSLDNLIEAEITLRKDLETLSLSEILNRYLRLSEKDFDTIEEDPDLNVYLESHDDLEEPNESEIDEQSYKKNLLDYIKHDLGLIQSIKNNINKLLLIPNVPYSYKDAKMEVLSELLQDRINSKTIIFTQFRDTADYLGYHIKNLFPNKNIEIVKGGDKNKEELVKRFSPTSNDSWVENNRVFTSYEDKKGQKYDIYLGPEIEILISTDTLSEGVNLQDCDYVINYDLPWNPTRIIQRVGRVDRIGSNSQKFVYHLRTDKEIESLLGLMDRLQNKVEQIALIVGREHGILSDEEVPNIKTIGEKIKHIQNTQNLDDLEKTALNSLFKDVKFGERKDSEIRLELREMIKEANLIEDDFKAYSLTKGGYSLIIDENQNRQFPFIYFKIYDQNTHHSLQDILLRMNNDGSIEEITPLSIKVSQNTLGKIKEEYLDTTKLETDLKMIKTEFENKYYFPVKEQFNPAKKSHREFPKIQQEIVYRFKEMRKQTKIVKEQRNAIEIKKWITIYSIMPFKPSDAQKLRKQFKDVPILQVEEKQFYDILEDFYNSIIKNNAEYQESVTLEKDIKYDQICWGAFIPKDRIKK